MPGDTRRDRVGLPSPGARWRAACYTCQASATLAWWGGVAMSPTWRGMFAFGDDGRSLLPFLPGDLVFWILASLLAARAEWTAAPARRSMRLVIAGAVGCSFVTAAGAAACVGSGWAGVLLMAPAVVMTTWLAWCPDR